MFLWYSGDRDCRADKKQNHGAAGEESWYKTQDLQGEIANLRVNLLE